MFDQVIPAADKDIVKVFTKRISKKFNLMLETKVTAVEAKEDGIYVSMEGKKSPCRSAALRRGSGGYRPCAER
jgi:dihydrolipoamide dehydrogenase